MKFNLPKDFFSNPTPPEIYLCNTSKRILGQLNYNSGGGVFKWNSYSEISFSVDRTYTDILTGETKINPLLIKCKDQEMFMLKTLDISPYKI